MGCTSLVSLLCPLFYFLDDVSYPQSVLKLYLGNAKPRTYLGSTMCQVGFMIVWHTLRDSPPKSGGAE